MYVCVSVSVSHIFELLSMIHFAMQGTMCCPTTNIETRVSVCVSVCVSCLSVCLCVCLAIMPKLSGQLP